MKKIKILFALTAILFAFAGCNSCNQNRPKEEIKIGAILPLTGESAFWGINIKNGIELGVEEINNNGGVQGKTINIIYEDTKGDGKTGTEAIHKLITTDKVQAVIGDVISSVILAVAPIMEKNKIPLIGFGESVAITDAGDYIFRNWNSAASDIKITSEYAAQHSNKMIVFSQNDAYGKSAKRLMQDYLVKNNIQIVFQSEFNKGESDFRTLITQFKNLDFDGIYMAGFHEEAIIFLKQCKELNVKSVNIYGVSSWEENTLIDFIKANYTDKVFYGYPLPPESNSTVVKSFTVDFQKKYNKAPEILCDNGYDAIYQFKYAIEKAGAYDGEKIKDALYTLKDFEGASGKMSFDKNGDVDKPFGMKVITANGAEWLSK